jgi:hypothetical protein
LGGLVRACLVGRPGNHLANMIPAGFPPNLPRYPDACKQGPGAMAAIRLQAGARGHGGHPHARYSTGRCCPVLQHPSLRPRSRLPCAALIRRSLHSPVTRCSRLARSQGPQPELLFNPSLRASRCALTRPKPYTLAALRASCRCSVKSLRWPRYGRSAPPTLTLTLAPQTQNPTCTLPPPRRPLSPAFEGFWTLNPDS